MLDFLSLNLCDRKEHLEDLRGQIVVIMLGERRLKERYDRYGQETLVRSNAELIAKKGQRLREVVKLS